MDRRRSETEGKVTMGYISEIIVQADSSNFVCPVTVKEKYGIEPNSRVISQSF